MVANRVQLLGEASGWMKLEFRLAVEWYRSQCL